MVDVVKIVHVVIVDSESDFFFEGLKSQSSIWLFLESIVTTCVSQVEKVMNSTINVMFFETIVIFLTSVIADPPKVIFSQVNFLLLRTSL